MKEYSLEPQERVERLDEASQRSDYMGPFVCGRDLSFNFGVLTLYFNKVTNHPRGF